jgi:hypothetical protein
MLSTSTLPPGGRAPDARGLTRDTVAAPFRLSTLLDRRDHTTLPYTGDGIAADAVASFEATTRDQAQALPCRQVGRKRTGCRAMIASEALAS